MSLLNLIKVKLGISPTQSNNFVLDASAADGTMKLARANNQDVLTVDAAGVLNAVNGLKKGGSIVQALSDFTGTNVNLSSNGYQKLPSGLIIQWMQANCSVAGTVNSFPIAFPNLSMMIVMTSSQASTGVTYGGNTTSQFTAYSASGTPTAAVMAVGK